MGEIIPIIIMSVKVAIPTVLLIIGINLLIVSHGKWESIIGRLVGVNDLEISKTAFMMLKLVALGLVALSLFIIYVFFVKDKIGAQASLPFSPRGMLAVVNHSFGLISGISLS